jgi:antitoxin (DNA-binding transcriptional repressor) of toxin-antitoxin stability system
MTITVAEAQSKLAQIIAQVEAGEEIYIAREPNHPAVKLVPLALGGACLARHPDLIGSTVMHDPVAFPQSLPPEDWGNVADR